MLALPKVPSDRGNYRLRWTLADALHAEPFSPGTLAPVAHVGASLTGRAGLTEIKPIQRIIGLMLQAAYRP